MMRFSVFALVFALVTGAVPALAQEFKAGDITIDKAWARATPKGADVGAGYLVVHNNGGTPERLTGGSADFASVEIHEMKMEGGVMTMRKLAGGLSIPAHGAVRLEPSGYHVMFTHLAKPLTKGEKVRATLTFEHAGPITVEFPVEAVGASGGGAMKGDMGGMKM